MESPLNFDEVKFRFGVTSKELYETPQNKSPHVGNKRDESDSENIRNSRGNIFKTKHVLRSSRGNSPRSPNWNQRTSRETGRQSSKNSNSEKIEFDPETSGSGFVAKLIDNNEKLNKAKIIEQLYKQDQANPEIEEYANEFPDIIKMQRNVNDLPAESIQQVLEYKYEPSKEEMSQDDESQDYPIQEEPSQDISDQDTSKQDNSSPDVPRGTGIGVNLDDQKPEFVMDLTEEKVLQKKMKPNGR